MDKQISRWPLEQLHTHPRQQSLFCDLNQQAFQELVEDLRSNGQMQPLEVMSDGTLICGHQRLRAARLLGWTDIEVWVRSDLERDGAAAIEQRLITDNLHRRQLDKLSLGRCYQRLRALQASLPKQRRGPSTLGDARDLIASKLGCSGRNLDRYLRVLTTPLEVQAAVSLGQISLVQAGAIARLAPALQQELAAQLRSGMEAKTVIRAYLKRAETAADRDKELQKLAQQAQNALYNLLDKQTPQRALTVPTTRVLESCQKLINRILARAGNTATNAPVATSD